MRGSPQRLETPWEEDENISDILSLLPFVKHVHVEFSREYDTLSPSLTAAMAQCLSGPVKTVNISADGDLDTLPFVHFPCSDLVHLVENATTVTLSKVVIEPDTASPSGLLILRPSNMKTLQIKLDNFEQSSLGLPQFIAALQAHKSIRTFVFTPYMSFAHADSADLLSTVVKLLGSSLHELDLGRLSERIMSSKQNIFVSFASWFSCASQSHRSQKQ